MDAEAGFGRQVVGGVKAGEEGVALAGRVAQPAQHGEDLLGVDDQRRLVAVEAGVEDGAGVVAARSPPGSAPVRGRQARISSRAAS